MTARPSKKPFIPPRWFVRIAWAVHRGVYKITGGRKGLWQAEPSKWGAMRLTAIGRRTGQERSVILGYFEDGPNLVTMAMNGWGEGHPSWWLNLLANPDATVVLTDETRKVHASKATGSEYDRLWARWRDMGDDLDGYAKERKTETPIVVLAPR